MSLSLLISRRLGKIQVRTPLISSKEESSFSNCSHPHNFVIFLPNPKIIRTVQLWAAPKSLSTTRSLDQSPEVAARQRFDRRGKAYELRGPGRCCRRRIDEPLFKRSKHKSPDSPTLNRKSNIVNHSRPTNNQQILTNLLHPILTPRRQDTLHHCHIQRDLARLQPNIDRRFFRRRRLSRWDFRSRCGDLCSLSCRDAGCWTSCGKGGESTECWCELFHWCAEDAGRSSGVDGERRERRTADSVEEGGFGNGG